MSATQVYGALVNVAGRSSLPPLHSQPPSRKLLTAKPPPPPERIVVLVESLQFSLLTPHTSQPCTLVAPARLQNSLPCKPCQCRPAKCEIESVREQARCCQDCELLGCPFPSATFQHLHRLPGCTLFFPPSHPPPTLSCSFTPFLSVKLLRSSVSFLFRPGKFRMLQALIVPPSTFH